MKLEGNVPHPIPYQGSKRILAAAILARMPPTFGRLVEPFCGSAAISLAAKYRRMTRQVWLNDAHKPLADLWRTILERPKELSMAYTRLWNEQLGREREYFDTVRDKFNRKRRPEHFLYLLARCVKAAIRYNAEGHFNNTPDNRRKGARPTQMRWRITSAAELLGPNTVVTDVDYRDVLSRCERGDVIYMDPPYQGVYETRDTRYAPKVDRQEFCEALAAMNRRKTMFLVSYDGRCGDKQYGEPLPARLRLTRLELCAGRSTQATLLGRDDVTYESLYLSPALVSEVGRPRNRGQRRPISVA
jgi:DNA adenine methylase